MQEERELRELSELVFASLNFALALVGNSLSLAVFTRTRLRGVPSGGHLAALAVSDAMFTIIRILLCTVLKMVILPAVLSCSIVHYLYDLFTLLSPWYFLCFTVERYVSACHPFRAPQILARITERRVFIIVTVVACCLCIYKLTPAYHPYKDNPYSWSCRGTQSERTLMYYYVYSIAFLLLTFVIPMTLILVLNVL